jgi:signal transduction histidine kinase
MPQRTIRDPEALGRLIDAMLTIGTDLTLENVLRRIVEAAVGLVDARYGALGVLDSSLQNLVEFVTVGLTPDEIEAIGLLPNGHGILGTLILEPEPLRLPDLTKHADTYGFPSRHPPMASFLGVPIRIRDRVYGNLYLTDKVSAAEFSADDEALAVALAGAAAIAIDNARLHEQVRDLALAEDRERIAADLHDTVIQRLFATGLALEGALRIAPPELADRIERSIVDLDETIRQIRTAIFAIHVPRTDGPSLRAEIVGLVASATRSLGFEPSLRMEGPIDSAVPGATATQVVAVLSEILANAARHAHATDVKVSVEITSADVLVVRVCDNGVGMGDFGAGGSGLRNLAYRAALLGGSVSASSNDNGCGTTVQWEVPLKADDSAV